MLVASGVGVAGMGVVVALGVEVTSPPPQARIPTATAKLAATIANLKQVPQIAMAGMIP